MKSVALYYFSGTGNTEIVANMFREEFLRHEYSVDVIRIEDVLKNNLKIETEKYDLIGVGSQVLGYGVPNIVKKFIRTLPRSNGRKAFLFRTAGGVHPQNYNASKPMLKGLAKKGYDVFHERIFAIGSNWVVRFDDAVVKQLYEATRRKVSLMCDALIRGEKRIYETGFWLKLKMGFIAASATPVFRLVGKDYKVSDNCTHCGLCVKTCPAGNIVMKNGKVKFKLSCNCCMRCVYACPNKAINFRLFKFFRVPGDYDIKKILEQPDGSPALIKGKTPPFSNQYIQDVEF